MEHLEVNLPTAFGLKRILLLVFTITSSQPLGNVSFMGRTPLISKQELQDLAVFLAEQEVMAVTVL